MQAVILVGGEGTRLRPLTSTVPKPVVPLVDRPFIVYMLEWLKHHGVNDLMLNGDVLTDIDLSAQIAQHERTGATGTLALVPVPDPTNYGLVRLGDQNA